MAEIVEVRRTEIPEVTTTLEVIKRLDQIYEKGLPGFIIRATGLVDVGANSHDDVTRAILALLPDTVSRVLQERDTCPVVGRTILLGTFWNSMTGDLHHDQHHSNGVIPDLRVHETTEGGGQVVLANAGFLGIDSRFPGGRIWWQGVEDADRLLLAGFADPNIVNPEIYSGDLSAGDKLVFSVAIPPSDSHDKAGPVWHRFDTDITPRSAEVQLIRVGRISLI